MNRELRPILAILAVAAVLVLVVLAFRPGTTEVVVQPTVDVPPPGTVGPDGSPVAVVISQHRSQETSFFGFIRGDTHYFVAVQFYAPSECVGMIGSGSVWPTGSSACASDVTIEGSVSGTGSTPTGEAIVVVDVEVSEECYSVTQGGDWWPLAHAECP